VCFGTDFVCCIQSIYCAGRGRRLLARDRLRQLAAARQQPCTSSILLVKSRIENKAQNSNASIYWQRWPTLPQDMKESLLQSPVELELLSHDENLDDPLLQQQQPALYHGTVGGHSGPVNWAAFGPDSCRLLTCSDDKTARLLNLRTKSVAIMRGHDAAVTFGEFSRGSAVALTCSRDGSVRLWNADSGSVIHILRPSSPAHMAVFSPSGAQLVRRHRR
jgi:WD40 repeat protein